MAERDDLNVSMIATVGIVSVILTAVSIYAVQALYFNYVGVETQRKVIEVRAVDSESRLAEQEARLARYSWVDRQKGTVTVPIERAMSLVVPELQSEQKEAAPIAATRQRGSGP